ncbi:Hypothetical predicted protein [Podarcis lilfordi]|uniref:Uncharacterized protein n=1 Tax=Podarcis lilfordi TaxID=74358 RepID=A0AA35P1D7_9SAUR|nr:Hypothetical predicted protein [Podarcis lilfordi]
MKKAQRAVASSRRLLLALPHGIVANISLRAPEAASPGSNHGADVRDVVIVVVLAAPWHYTPSRRSPPPSRDASLRGSEGGAYRHSLNLEEEEESERAARPSGGRGCFCKLMNLGSPKLLAPPPYF